MESNQNIYTEYIANEIGINISYSDWIRLKKGHNQKKCSVKEYWSNLGFTEGSRDSYNLSISFEIAALLLTINNKYTNKYKDKLDVLVFPIIRRIFEKQNFGETILEINKSVTNILDQLILQDLSILDKHNVYFDIELQFVSSFCDNFKFTIK